MPIFQSPFSPAYWRTAAQEMKNYRSLVFSALMIAACIVLSHCTIRVGEGLSVSVTFLARALCSLVCGPVMVILFGAAEDTLSFFLSSGGYPRRLFWTWCTVRSSPSTVNFTSRGPNSRP